MSVNDFGDWVQGPIVLFLNGTTARTEGFFGFSLDLV